MRGNTTRPAATNARRRSRIEAAANYAGHYVYVAEGITPSVQRGESLMRGQPIAAFNSHSIEIGFAAGQGDLALANPAYHPDGADTGARRAINRLLTSLGAPPGHQDGPRI